MVAITIRAIIDFYLFFYFVSALMMSSVPTVCPYPLRTLSSMIYFEKIACVVWPRYFFLASTQSSCTCILFPLQYVLEELNVRSLVPCNDTLKYASLRAEPEFRYAFHDFM